MLTVAVLLAVICHGAAIHGALMPVIAAVSSPIAAPLVLVLHRLCIAASIAYVVLAVIVLTVTVLLAVVRHGAALGGALMPVVVLVAAPGIAPHMLMLRGLVAVGRSTQYQQLTQIAYLVLSVCISHITAVNIDGVSAGGVPAGSGQEELALITYGALVAVGNVHQVVAALQTHDIPHMAFGVGQSALHLAGGGIAGRILKFAQVAEILEGLGIALAYHLGIGVAVKYIYELPGIAVLGIFLGHRILVIGCELAYLVLVSQQLFIIAAAFIGSNNAPGIYCGIVGRCHLGIVYLINIQLLSNPPLGLLGAVGLPEIRADGESKVQGCHRHAVFHRRIAQEGLHAAVNGLVIPIQIKRQVHHQIGMDTLYIHLFKQLVRDS